jgi:hypothetical protein
VNSGLIGKALAGGADAVEKTSFEAMRAQIMADRDAKLNEYNRALQTEVVQPFQAQQTDKTIQAHKDISAATNATHVQVANINAAAHKAAQNMNKTIGSDKDGRLFYLDDNKKPVFLMDPETGDPIIGPKDNGLTKAIVESYTSEISAVAKDQLTPEDQKGATIQKLRQEMFNALKNPDSFGKPPAPAAPAGNVNDIAAIWRGSGKPSAPAQPAVAPAAAAPGPSLEDQYNANPDAFTVTRNPRTGRNEYQPRAKNSRTGKYSD